MPRGPRVDAEGALYHVICRGVERRPIFRDDTDRSGFLARLERLVVEEGASLFAYVLLDNHVHLVLRREGRPLGQLMRRLLTGHSVSFNRRHRRAGHLFQNRYRAVLCEEDAYLLQLVRYVHLNPVRAKLVKDPSTYEWSSHRAYLRRRAPAWLRTEMVLEQLGGRAAYRRFISEGYREGKRGDLCGVDGGGKGTEEEGVRRLWLGSQVLGGERFARSLARRQRGHEGEREMRRGRAEELPGLMGRVAKRFGVPEERLRGRGRSAVVSRARRALVRAAVVERGIRPVDVSRALGISTASVSAHLRAIEEHGV
jgi:putative transposase